MISAAKTELAHSASGTLSVWGECSWNLLIPPFFLFLPRLGLSRLFSSSSLPLLLFSCLFLSFLLFSCLPPYLSLSLLSPIRFSIGSVDPSLFPSVPAKLRTPSLLFRFAIASFPPCGRTSLDPCGPLKILPACQGTRISHTRGRNQPYNHLPDQSGNISGYPGKGEGRDTKENPRLTN